MSGLAIGSVLPLGFNIISDAFPQDKRTQMFMLWYFLGGFGLEIGFGLAVTMIGILSDFFNSLRFPIMIVMSLWIASGIAWFYLAWYYEYDLNFVKGVF